MSTPSGFLPAAELPQDIEFSMTEPRHTPSQKPLVIVGLASLVIFAATVLSRQILPGTEFSPFWPATGVIFGLTLFYSCWYGVAMVPVLIVWTLFTFGSGFYHYSLFASIGAIIPILSGVAIRKLWRAGNLFNPRMSPSRVLVCYAFGCFFVTLPSALLSGSILFNAGLHGQASFAEITSIYWLSEFAGFILFFPFVFMLLQNNQWYRQAPSRLTLIMVLCVALVSFTSDWLPGLYKQLPVFICLPLLAFYALTERNPLYVHGVIVFWVINGLFIASQIPLVEGENNALLFVSGYTLLLVGGTLTLHLIWLVTNKQRALAQTLKLQTLLDLRTDLLNERGLTQRLQQKQGDGYAALIVRLHQSKDMIESLGLDKFPVILKEISARLTRQIPAIEDVGVIGGASVVAVFKHDQTDLAQVAQHIDRVLTATSYLDDGSLSIQDLDVAVLSFDHNHRGEILEDLTVAAYLASQNPINRILVGSASDAELMAPLENFRQLQQVKALLDQGNLEMWGQAIVPTSDQSLVNKVELLARIRRNDGEILQPGYFMPLFEQFGFQSEFDKYVVRAAFALIIQDTEGAQHYTINVSAQSFAQIEFPDFVRHYIDEYGVNPASFSFEITESDALPSVETTRRNIEIFNQQGINVGIDDFGTGFATYSYLIDLPFNFVKIDGRFIHDIETNAASLQAVKAIVSIAAEFKMLTVAEYVESQAIREILMALGVDYVQGYGIDKPTPLSFAS
ncbi:MAG: hypothetical protein AseanaTS_25030 [Candidatus Pelagadaptatus aseana]|uniref:sensor domain-containing phosphodiesterase n=1 Tax=Candidatus Pelagadaptatus aseana TaxID=3120508 RepID=UPI0039B291CB